MADGLTITLGATQLVVIAKMAVDFLGARAKDARATAAANTAGDKPPEYWQGEFRAAIDEKLDQRVIPILAGQKEIMASQAEILKGLSAQVSEFVAVNRTRRR